MKKVLLILTVLCMVFTVCACDMLPFGNKEEELENEKFDIQCLERAKALGESLDADGVEGTFFFNPELNKLVQSSTGIKGYGKGSILDGGCPDFKLSTSYTYDGTVTAKGKIIEVVISTGSLTDRIKLRWVGA